LRPGGRPRSPRRPLDKVPDVGNTDSSGAKFKEPAKGRANLWAAPAPGVGQAPTVGRAGGGSRRNSCIQARPRLGAKKKTRAEKLTPPEGFSLFVAECGEAVPAGTRRKLSQALPGQDTLQIVHGGDGVIFLIFATPEEGPGNCSGFRLGSLKIVRPQTKRAVCGTMTSGRSTRPTPTPAPNPYGDGVLPTPSTTLKNSSAPSRMPAYAMHEVARMRDEWRAGAGGAGGRQTPRLSSMRFFPGSRTGR